MTIVNLKVKEGKLEEKAKNLFASCNLIDSPKMDKNQNIVIKVRTESFDAKSN